jgi:diadenosine tetraphosphate (Ap4A) HIT family hydrolase
MSGRISFDIDEYVKRSTQGGCFVCQLLGGNPDYEHVVIFETKTAVVFLNKFPTMFGYIIVAPKEHLCEVTGSFSEEEYLELQSLIYRTSEAVRMHLRPERVYILSIGSIGANAHVHWHVAPLPPGVPLDKQQYYALMHENGVIKMTRDEAEDYAMHIRKHLEGS